MPTKQLDVVVAAKALGIEATDRQLKSLARTLRETNGGGGGLLKSLKGGLGEESGFGGAFKIFRGAGAVAGLGLAGSVLNQGAERARELAMDMAFSEKSSGELVEELLKSIPVYGQIIAAGRTIRGLVDGTTIATERLNRENAKTAELLQVQDELLKGMREGTGNPVQIQASAAVQRRALQHELDDIRAGVLGPNAKMNRARQQLGVMGFSLPSEDRSARAREIEGELARLAREEAAAMKDARERRRQDFRAELLGQRADLERQIPGKELEADRDSIRERYARDEAAVIKRLRDPSLDPIEKEYLQKSLTVMPRAMRDELFNVAIHPAPPNQARFDSQMRLTGAGELESRKDRTPDKQLDGIKELLKLNNEIQRRILAVLQAGDSGPQIAR